MTHFEYLIVAFSILIAMAIARLLEGLLHQARVKTSYWLHIGWLVMVLMNALTLWWVLWDLNEAEWNLLTFLFLWAGPVLLFAQAAALVPFDPNTVGNWRDHYFDNARIFFLIRATAVVQTMTATQVTTDVLPMRVLYLGAPMILILVAAAFIKDERYHIAVLTISYALLFSAIATLV